jgi:tetratricopeptide (TPR) repeat protein
MAPELLSGRPWDHRADIFSLGVVFYEALAGQHPFPGAEDRAAMTNRLLHDDPSSLRKLNPTVPAGLERIIGRMLSKNPAERQSSAGDLLADLKVVQEMLDSGAWKVLHFPGGKPAVSAVASILAIFLAGAVLIADHPVRPVLNRSGLPLQKNLIVLPFHAIGGGVENQEFSQGLTEAVTVKLAELSRDHIAIAPQSLVRDHHVESIEDARRELDATLILDGSLYRTPDSIQMTYGLFDAATHSQLRGATETFSAVEPFALQERLVANVAQMLELALTASEMKLVTRRETHVPQAYDHYTVGIGYIRDYESLEKTNLGIESLRRALELDGNYALAYAGLGEAYWIKFTQFEPRNPTLLDQADLECRHSIQLDPLSAAGHNCLGNLLNTRGQHEKALPEFTEALRIEPRNEQAYLGLGQAQQGLNDLDGAEKTFQQAIELASSYWVGYSALAYFYFEHSRYADAARVYENMLSLQPGNAYAYQNLGAAYVLLGKYEQANEALRKAISMRPTYVAYSSLGSMYWRLRRFDEATPMFEQAFRMQPDYSVAGNLARAYYWTRGRRNEALQMYQRAIELGEERLKINPDDPDVHILLARYCAVLGRRSEAIEHAKVGLKQHSNDKHFLEIAAVAYNQLGDTANAIGFLQKAVANHLSAPELLNEMELDNLRDLPQFQQLIKTVQIENKN